MCQSAHRSMVESGAVDAMPSAADESRRPMSLDMVYDLAIVAGIDSTSLVVDGGCATGEPARMLIRRTGCRVDGVETAGEGVTGAVPVERASSQA